MGNDEHVSPRLVCLRMAVTRSPPPPPLSAEQPSKRRKSSRGTNKKPDDHDPTTMTMMMPPRDRTWIPPEARRAAGNIESKIVWPLSAPAMSNARFSVLSPKINHRINSETSRYQMSSHLARSTEAREAENLAIVSGNMPIEKKKKERERKKKKKRLLCVCVTLRGTVLQTALVVTPGPQRFRPNKGGRGGVPPVPRNIEVSPCHEDISSAQSFRGEACGLNWKILPEFGPSHAG
ncbi:hypothetical protein LX36DRAFT_247286 [Colletotrichum falcatum]|nr:hypothetical protein LX36DRAFT_247286 [Colletotrichum falcatum]